MGVFVKGALPTVYHRLRAHYDNEQIIIMELHYHIMQVNIFLTRNECRNSVIAMEVSSRYAYVTHVTLCQVALFVTFDLQKSVQHYKHFHKTKLCSFYAEI